MAKISEKIQSLTGNSNEKIKEQFTFLQQMAQAKCEQFQAELKEMFMSEEVQKIQIVGKRAFKYYQSQHIDIKSGCNDKIEEAIDSFFEGEAGIKDGFKRIVSAAIEVFIGKSSIGESCDSMFWVYPENSAIVRVDLKVYKYEFIEKGFISDCKNIFCYTMAKSIVDHRKLTQDELVYFITQMCKDEKSGKVKLDEVKEYIQKLKEVWNLLEDGAINHIYSDNCILLDSKTITDEVIKKATKRPGALTYEYIKEYAEKGIDGLNNLEHKRPYRAGIDSIDTGRDDVFKYSPRFRKPELKRSTNILMQGSRKMDYVVAENATGGERPEGTVWHHVYDYNNGYCTMQLVDVSVHTATIPHVGAVRQYEEAHSTTYKAIRKQNKFIIDGNVSIMKSIDVFDKIEDSLRGDDDCLLALQIGEYEISCNDDVVLGGVFDEKVKVDDNKYIWGYDVYGNMIYTNAEGMLSFEDHESCESFDLNLNVADIKIM